MSEHKQEWFLSQKNINSTKIGIFKIYPCSRGIVVGNEKIEGKGLLELNFDQQDLEVEKFVFKEIHIASLQIDDAVKVCIDIDKSLKNFKNKFKNLSPHIVKSLEKLSPLIDASRKQSEDLMRSKSFSAFSDIAKQIKASVESIKPPAIIDPIDKLNFVNYGKYLQPQAKTLYRFCFEKCTLEEVDFANEVRHDLEFKDNIFLKYCQILNKTFLEKVEFLDNVFEQLVSIKESNFKKSLSFKTHKDTKEWNLAFSHSDFEGEVFVIGNKLEQAKIESSTFYENMYFGLDHPISPNGECGYSKFDQGFILQDAVFLKKAYFERCDFSSCVIESCKFQDDTFFDYSSFDEIRILKTLFGQRVSFYHTTFCQPPLFANCVFDKYLTMIGSKLVLNGSEFIEKVRKSTNDLCLFNDQGAGTISKPNNKCEPDDFLKDYRDGFCTIKNALIKNNNLLDASSYHKAELYCKEEELNFQKPKIFSREWVDKWQLWFYRLTSDHHTDLAKIFNNVIMLIALFGIFAFGLNSFATHDLSTSNIPQKFVFGMISKTPHLVAFLGLGLLLGIGILTEILRAYKTHLKSIVLSLLWRSIPSMVLLLILCVLGYESFSLLPLWLQEVIFIFGVCSSFVGIYLFLLWRESRVWIAISYIVSLGILIFKPSLLLPFVGQLFGEGLKANFSAMQSLSVVYCILMVLMLFSLQKTARKNSIIPS